VACSVKELGTCGDPKPAFTVTRLDALGHPDAIPEVQGLVDDDATDALECATAISLTNDACLTYGPGVQLD
jgi:hypothetical protein